jgi:hypothetical protein
VVQIEVNNALICLFVLPKLLSKFRSQVSSDIFCLSAGVFAACILFTIDAPNAFFSSIVFVVATLFLSLSDADDIVGRKSKFTFANAEIASAWSGLLS